MNNFIDLVTSYSIYLTYLVVGTYIALVLVKIYVDFPVLSVVAYARIDNLHRRCARLTKITLTEYYYSLARVMLAAIFVNLLFSLFFRINSTSSSGSMRTPWTLLVPYRYFSMSSSFFYVFLFNKKEQDVVYMLKSVVTTWSHIANK